MKKRGEATERRGFIVKCRETLRRACESHVGLSMCDNPMETVFIKRWVPLER